jgi:hypothetical protein
MGLSGNRGALLPFGLQPTQKGTCQSAVPASFAVLTISYSITKNAKLAQVERPSLDSQLQGRYFLRAAVSDGTYVQSSVPMVCFALLILI